MKLNWSLADTHSMRVVVIHSRSNFGGAATVNKFIITCPILGENQFSYFCNQCVLLAEAREGFNVTFANNSKQILLSKSFVHLLGGIQHFQ